MINSTINLYFGRSGGRRIPPIIYFFIFFLDLWAHLHNLIKQNNNFPILQKIENPLSKTLKKIAGTCVVFFAIVSYLLTYIF